MNNFEYALPESIGKAIEYLQVPGARLKAGGIDLLDMMKEELIAPKRLVSIRDMEDLRFLKKADNGDLHIGAAITLSELAAHKELNGACKALAQAAGRVATPQIRNAATLGGNLCQRPRCWYFRSADFHCLRKGGDECFAQDGENQFHAILGNSDGCIIVHPSGTAVALMALQAKLLITNGKEEKEVPVEEFFVTPAQNIQHENILEPGELITTVIIPADMMSGSSDYHKQMEKDSFDWPLADVAVTIKKSGNTCTGARIVLGSAAPVPWRVEKAEQVLINVTIDKEKARQAAGIAMEDAEPFELNRYKIPIFKTVIYRTICRAAGIDPMS
jgi:xanthine dehydrogenase YagS FAD-binding subunit